MNNSKMVFGTKTHCPKCGTPRDGDDFGGVQMVRGVGDRDGSNDWPCPNTSCLNSTKMVFGRHESCPACGTSRNAKYAGDWACPNRTCVNHTNTVFASKLQCPKCGTPKPFPGQQQARVVQQFQQQMQMQMPVQRAFGGQMPVQHGFGGRGMHGVMQSAPMMGQMHGVGDWQCPNSGCVNNSKMVFGKNPSCPKCGSPKPAAVMMGGGMMGGMMGGMHGSNGAGDWQCPTFDCVNHAKMVFGKNSSCPKCGSPKPAAVVPMMPGGASQPGDWQCPNQDCQNHSRMVFGKNASCPKCGVPKPIGGDFGGGMGMGSQRGGSHPGDWRCPNSECKNHRNNVFAKHNNCPSCGTEKPDMDVFGGVDRSRSPRGRGVFG